MNSPKLLNPAGKLISEIEASLTLARKAKSLWAKRLETSTVINSLEGPLPAEAGDYICRGIHGEFWPQKARKLFDTYHATDQFNSDGWQQFSPKPDSAPVQAVQIDFPFSLTSHWGELVGKAKDYVVRSTSDSSDCWIVDRAIFESSYEFEKGSS